MTVKRFLCELKDVKDVKDDVDVSNYMSPARCVVKNPN